ncbi:hypothetical protein LVJ94_03225 [Pendulispora rubella]|uniref:Uncharacterized protein n=1 Tax=Pendulispora rubella TaxID=2741070 RepID=A0ABZ2L5W3_9BACT
MQWGLDQWLITDAFLQEWRFWVAPLEGRANERKISRWDMPREPLFHLIPQAFNESGAREDDVAADLLAIYDTLTGARLAAELPQPTRDRRRRLRGFTTELSRVLYAAMEAGVLRFERHEVPWPFPEKEEKPEDRRDEAKKDEEETFLYKLRLHDGRYGRCSTLDYRLVLANGQVVTGTTDGTGLIEQRLPKREQTIHVKYAPPDLDHEIEREVIVLPETTTDADYIAHLRNMGFDRKDDHRAIIGFQAAHKELIITGTLDQKTKNAINAVVTGQLNSGIQG